jgi:hypothetical protein
MAAGKWRRTRSPKMAAAGGKAARAEARDYLTGVKQRRYESPQMIAKHGRAPWPPRKAAAEAYADVLRYQRVEDRYPSGSLYRHRARKGGAGATVKTKTSRGGTWTLRKANVRRDKTSGQFRSRRSS